MYYISCLNLLLTYTLIIYIIPGVTTLTKFNHFSYFTGNEYSSLILHSYLLNTFSISSTEIPKTFLAIPLRTALSPVK